MKYDSECNNAVISLPRDKSKVRRTADDFTVVCIIKLLFRDDILYKYRTCTGRFGCNCGGHSQWWSSVFLLPLFSTCQKSGCQRVAKNRINTIAENVLHSIRFQTNEQRSTARNNNFGKSTDVYVCFSLIRRQK